MFDDGNEQTVEDEGPADDRQSDLFIAEVPQGDLFDPDSLSLFQARAMDRGAIQQSNKSRVTLGELDRRGLLP